MQEHGKKMLQVVWNVIRAAIILVVVILVLLFLLAMGSQRTTGEIIDPSFQEIYRIDGEEYALHKKYVLVRFEAYELRRFGEDTTVLHRFPLGQKPLWSEDQNVFFYMKGRDVFQWDPVTNQEDKVWTLTKSQEWNGWEQFFQSKSYRLRGAWEDYLLLCRGDGMPVLVDLSKKQEILLDNIKDYLSFSFMATEDYLLFANSGKAVKTFSLETGEVMKGTLPLTEFTVRFWDHQDNAVVLTASMSGEETLFWYNAADHDLRNLTLQKREDGTEAVKKDIVRAQMIWDNVVYVEQTGDTSFVLNRVDLEGNPMGTWKLPSCEAVKVLIAEGNRLLLVTASPAANYSQVLSYYQLTEGGQLNLVYQWDSVSNHALNTCHVILEGDLVISGCPTESELIRFTLE